MTENRPSIDPRISEVESERLNTVLNWLKQSEDRFNAGLKKLQMQKIYLSEKNMELHMTLVIKKQMTAGFLLGLCTVQMPQWLTA